MRFRNWSRWTPEQDEKLEQMYSDLNTSPETIAQVVGHSARAVKDRANKKGVRRRQDNRYDVVSGYFKEIDTEIKAYLLGFLAADGNVRNGTIRGELGDLMPVERLRDNLAPGAPITITRGRYFSWRICSVQMAADLAYWGVVPNKTLNFTWPQSLPEQFAMSFILGYFDGDGSITYQRNGSRTYLQWRLVGCESFLRDARKRIMYHAQVELREPIRHSKHRCPHLYQIQAVGEKAIKIDQMLNASKLGMPRKHV